MSEPMGPPAGWGDDRLTSFLDTARENQYATFHHLRAQNSDLIRLDAAFEKLFSGSINLNPWFPALFMLRAHSALRSASGLAMAGQLYEINPTLRASLENGAYGLYIGNKDKLAEKWLRRHDDDASKRAVKHEFTIRNISHRIGEIDRSLKDHFDTLYNQTIDYGGHPNERGYTLNFNIAESDDRKEFQTIYLQANPQKIELALKQTARTALWTLTACRILWKTRYELLRLDDEVNEIKQRY